MNFVNPSEIEELISTIDGVKQVCVVGIYDVEFQNLTTAAVIKKETADRLTEKKIIDHVAKVLPPYKHLHGGVYFVPSFPMTPSGKVIKRKVRDDLIAFKSQNAEIH